MGFQYLYVNGIWNLNITNVEIFIWGKVMGFNLFKVVLLTEKGFAGLSVVWGQSRKGIYYSLCTTCSGNPEWGFAAQPQFSGDDNKFLQLLSTANKVEKHLLKND